ncbi:Mll1962 protein [alpha proteobacterium U9-1i]|nr:Mll1962 protein [alpha proteobacterium U9-1i]
MSNSSKLFAAGALLLCLVAAPGALADGGGGTMSTPRTENPSAAGGRADPAEAYRLGVAAMEARNFGEAVRQFRVVQRAAPNDANVNFALGLAYMSNGDHDDARRPLERAANAENGPVGAHLQLGLVYLELNDREKALEQQGELQTMLNGCTSNCTDSRRAQIQAAYDALTRALNPETPAADPATTGWNFPSEHEGRLAYAAAVGLINTERYAEALDVLARSAAAVGPHADVLNYMGFASRKLGRTDAALGYYREALALDPDHLGANEYLGELYIQMGRMDDARRQLARLDSLCAYGCAQREELARWIELASN